METRNRLTRRLTLPEAARALGLGWGRAYRLVLTGALPAEQVAGRYVVDGDAVEAYRQTQATTAGSTKA